MICSISDELKSRLDEVDIYKQCNWYRFPSIVQHIMPMIINNTQEMDFLKVFGTITASRETYKRVIGNGNGNRIGISWQLTVIHLYFKVANRGFSTFMILRTFVK